METLLLGLLLFLGVHSIRMIAPHWRQRAIAARGARAWRLGYAILAAAGLYLVARGYGLARLDPVPLYDPPPALRHLALVLLVPVFPLLAAAYAPGHIRARLGHPMLIATVLWGLAHLLANGTLADLVLFGGIGLWAAADWASSAARAKGAAETASPAWPSDAAAIAGGLAVYALTVLWLHGILIGVSPLAAG